MKYFNKISKEDLIRDSLVMSIALSLICFLAIYPQRHLLKYCRYTIATVKETDGENAKIIYMVDVKEYEGSISVYKGGGTYYKISDRVFVAFSPVDPDECNLIHKEVPNLLINAPKNGWDSIPK